ncbi:MAG: Methyltransferase [Bacteroidetes bacterium]|nr:Methyltransferase [Bacteroidota bacterium]
MDTLNRFSNRVDNYIKYRPAYPADVVTFLKKQGILKQDSIIADIGSGTGISSQLFLGDGNTVYAVEPNREMREAAERLLAGFSNFKSIAATAEETTLANNSVDIIIAGQAFHWFDKQKCKAEFKRILKPEGTVVLMWNDRRTDSTPFLRSYEDFIKMFATDYLEVNHKNIDEKVFNDFFGAGNYSRKSFDNFQYFDLEGLKGRILSSSYMPSEGHKDFEYMMYVLKKTFSRFQENGKVTIEYDTNIYYGRLS